MDEDRRQLKRGQISHLSNVYTARLVSPCYLTNTYNMQITTETEHFNM